MMTVTKNVFRASEVKELLPAAQALLERYPRERIFAFYGKMGVGKTTFIKTLCQELGVEDVVSSPTFSIVNQYNTLLGVPIYHFDFYRINKLEEVFDIGYEDYFFSGAYCLIEWPEKMESLLPDHCVIVTLEEQNAQRIIQF